MWEKGKVVRGEKFRSPVRHSTRRRHLRLLLLLGLTRAVKKNRKVHFHPESALYYGNMQPRGALAQTICRLDLLQPVTCQISSDCRRLLNISPCWVRARVAHLKGSDAKHNFPLAHAPLTVWEMWNLGVYAFHSICVLSGRCVGENWGKSSNLTTRGACIFCVDVQ